MILLVLNPAARELVVVEEGVLGSEEAPRRWEVRVSQATLGEEGMPAGEKRSRQ